MTASNAAAHLALDAVERQLEAVTQALRGHEPVQLAEATARLRTLALAASRTIEGARLQGDAPLRARLEAVQRLLGLQREQIARGQALADRAVQSVLPHVAGDSPTYAPGNAGRGGAARLYAALG